MGPALAKLLPQQRAFVRALIATGGGDNTKAARLAGYGGTNPQSAHVQASRLAHNPKVVEAIREEAERTIRASVALGAGVLVEIAKDAMHKDRFKAANALLDRGGMLLVQKSEVLHHHLTDEKSVTERITVLAERLGLDPVLLLGNVGSPVGRLASLSGPVVDAEFTEVSTGAEGLEDLL